MPPAAESYGGCLERALAARYGGSAAEGHPLPAQRRGDGGGQAAPATPPAAPPRPAPHPDVPEPPRHLVTDIAPLPAAARPSDPDAPAAGRCASGARAAALSGSSAVTHGTATAAGGPAVVQGRGRDAAEPPTGCQCERFSEPWRRSGGPAPPRAWGGLASRPHLSGRCGDGCGGGRRAGRRWGAPRHRPRTPRQQRPPRPRRQMLSRTASQQLLRRPPAGPLRP